MRSDSIDRVSRRAWVLAAAALAVAVAVLVGFYLADGNSKKKNTDNTAAVASAETPTPGIPVVARMLQPGMTYFSLGAHKLCYPETGGNRARGHVDCSPYNLEHNNLVTVLGDAVLGSDNAWYWPIQVLQGSFWAEFGDGDTQATWWLKDSKVLIEPIANASLIPLEPKLETDVTYRMNWSYLLRSGPAGAPIAGYKGPLLTAFGGQPVTLTGKQELRTTPSTGTRWWCQLATLGDDPIEKYLTHLPDEQRSAGAWVPCEFTRK